MGLQPDYDYIIPDKLHYNSDEASERAAIVSKVTSYVNDCTVKFIIGTMSIEKDWDEYVAQLKKMGIDRAVEITQNALDRFNNS